MRSFIILVALTNIVFLSACSTVGSRQPERLSQAASDCSELEGAPDCQDGHQLESPALQAVAGQYIRHYQHCPRLCRSALA